MEKHITDTINGLVGEEVAVQFDDGRLFSGIFKFRSDEEYVGYEIVTREDIHIHLSKDSIKTIKKGVIM